jgi:hypothetical protein
MSIVPDPGKVHRLTSPSIQCPTTGSLPLEVALETCPVGATTMWTVTLTLDDWVWIRSQQVLFTAVVCWLNTRVT